MHHACTTEKKHLFAMFKNSEAGASEYLVHQAVPRVPIVVIEL